MVQTSAQPLTLADFLQQPDTQPASEFIEGEILQKPMPQGEHSIIQGELVTAINAVTKPSKIARAFPELRCIFAGRAIVPDISVFLWENIPRNDNGKVANLFTLPSDWMIEILSPDQPQTQVTAKLLHAIKHNTQMGWLIDPSEQAVFVYYPDQAPDFFNLPTQVLPTPAFAGTLQLTIADLFGWLIE